MRFPPGAVTKRICGPGKAAEGRDEETGVATGFSPGAVTKRICGSEMAAGCLDEETGVTFEIDAGWSTGAAGKTTSLPHMMQVSSPCRISPPHLTQCFVIALFTPFAFLKLIEYFNVKHIILCDCKPF